MRVTLYVEGGGDHNKALQTQCRRGFSEFINRAGFQDRMPRIVASGGRRHAFDSFRTSHAEGTPGHVSMLLVDSEGPVDQTSPWAHVQDRDGWERPTRASDDQLHLMVQAMEAWFHADKDALATYYGESFRTSALSQSANVEGIPKADLFRGLERATQACEQKGKYSKGEHSFVILGKIDPARVRSASAWANRFINALQRYALT